MNDATIEIATTMQSYSKALKQSPATIGKHNLDSKVLEDTECKA